jgi:MYXO-CTERM domain-containing protein
VIAGVCLGPATAYAGDTLQVLETVVDPPTVISLGVQVLISDDDDRDATISLRFRDVGAPDWEEGLPLVRVRPELVTGLQVPQQFAGSVFDRRPDTEVEIELHAVDPDGFDMTWTVMARTRAVPRAEPALANAVAVTDVAGLTAALGDAAPGDVISVADGTYAGSFSIDASGTADNPIVIRGASSDGTILDGEGCDACNVLEVYGSFVHVERMTLQAANRALRFQGEGAQGNVVRRTIIRDVSLGIGARVDQRDFYICDNQLSGPLVWPQVYSDDGGMFANVDGIVVMGSGHVVCHNELIGFGDAIKTAQDGARAIDFYGNVTRSAYDNAIELDGSAGNSRALRNLLVNSYSPLSFQPIMGGPAYALRNVVVNVADEQCKLHSNGVTGETVGAWIAHNTFVSPRHAINLQAAATAHDFVLVNNLYVGPAAPVNGKTVDWSVPIDNGVIDYNGYFPDGAFDYDGADQWPDFAAMQAAGKFEAHGVLLTDGVFASGLVAPDDYTVELDLPDAALVAGSAAIDAGLPLANLGGVMGAGPDVGALEVGCAAPMFGVRPEGVDEDDGVPGCEDGGETSETGDSESTGDDSGSESGDSATTFHDGHSVTGDEAPTGDETPTGDDGPGGCAEDGLECDPGGASSGASEGSSGASGSPEEGEGGCGCRSDGAPAGLAGLVLLAWRRRRA